MATNPWCCLDVIGAWAAFASVFVLAMGDNLCAAGKQRAVIWRWNLFLAFMCSIDACWSSCIPNAPPLATVLLPLLHQSSKTACRTRCCRPHWCLCSGVAWSLNCLSALSACDRHFIFRPGNGSPSATNVVLLVVNTKAFSFHNRSSSNFAYRLVTTLSTMAQRRIFKLSPK